MTIVALGTTAFIRSGVEGLLDSGIEVAMLVSLPREALPANSLDLASFASEKHLEYLETADINSAEAVEAIRATRPDVIVSAWPRRIGAALLSVPRAYVVGTHPTELPFNRGRHPLHWLMALGHATSMVSFFVMNERFDAGPVLLQVPFSIAPDDRIRDVVLKMNAAAYEGAFRLGTEWRRGSLPDGVVQNEARANYWRTRTVHDVTLDLRVSAAGVVRTVRSFGEPYACANLIFEDQVIKIIDAGLAPPTLTPEELARMEPGRILDVAGSRLRVKAGDVVVELTSRDDFPPGLQRARYIHPPTKYLSEYPDVLLPRLRC